VNDAQTNTPDRDFYKRSGQAGWTLADEVLRELSKVIAIDLNGLHGRMGKPSIANLSLAVHFLWENGFVYASGSPLRWGLTESGRNSLSVCR
jgi:hypothetical protein